MYLNFMGVKKLVGLINYISNKDFLFIIILFTLSYFWANQFSLVRTLFCKGTLHNYKDFIFLRITLKIG